jgi:hypothetical protein
MAGLVPAIHVCLSAVLNRDVDARHRRQVYAVCASLTALPGMPRITALHMLRSTIATVSAPASSSFRGSITHPTQSLCHTPHAIAVYASCSASPPPHATLASRRLARPYLGRTYHRLIAPALPGAFLHSITSSARAMSCGDTSRPSPFAALRLMIISKVVGRRTGRSAGLSPLRIRPA